MNLRLTSNLLYGISLVYKQKTDYLNNDTILIKTKIQKDLFTKKEVLITDFKPTKISLLHDDPNFNINNLLPSLENLEFLNNEIESTKFDRINKIKEFDFKNNYQLNSSQSLPSSVDDLESNDPKFAFNEDGLLLDLELENTNLHIEDEINYDFDFGYEDPLETVNKDQEKGVNEIIHENIEENEPVNEPIKEPIGETLIPKKRKGNKIIVDDPISLFTDDLRSARDNYVLNMIKKPKFEKIIETEDYLPSFEINLNRGRSLRRSSSIEIRRNASNRRNSRSSLTPINLPEFQEDEPDYFNFDFGYDLGTPKKRSSSTIRKIETVNEEIELNFEKDLNSKFLNYIESVFIELNKEKVSFDEIIKNSERKIIVKSFYEILQLSTLNEIKIESKNKRFEIMNPSDIKIMLS